VNGYEWENQEVHNDVQNKRDQALKMGANILMFAFMQCFRQAQFQQIQF
jgi:hypothetical protein